MNKVLRNLLIVCMIMLLLYIMFIVYQKIEYKYLIKKREEYKKQLSNQKINYPINKLNNIPILFINMDKDKDRLKNITSQIKKYNIQNIYRIPGVNGKEINFEGDNLGDFSFTNNFSNLLTSKSELGCTLSHIRAIKYAYDNNLGTVMIIEDDVSFELMPYWKKSLKEIINEAPKDWKVIQLYSNCKLFKCIDCNKFVDSKKEYCSGSVAYTINKKGQEYIIKLFNNNILILDKNRLKSIKLDHLIPAYIEGFYSYRDYILLPDNDSENMESTIHPSHTNGHIRKANNILANYVNNLDIPRLEDVLKFDDIINTKLDNNKALSFIDMILYINLEHRKDRRIRFENEMNTLGINLDNIIRIPAIYTPNNGAIGCLLSHIKALSYMLNYYNDSIVLIAEDDIIFKKYNIKNMLDSIYNNLGNNWDVIMLAHNTYKKEDTNILFLSKVIDSQTSAAYIVNKGYVKNILNIFITDYNELLKSNIWKSEYCNDQSWKKLQKKDRWYSIDPAFIIQGKSYSDIENKEVDYKV
jgi:GR25 family glycosyltransferase involved in LPS biosynthesis